MTEALNIDTLIGQCRSEDTTEQISALLALGKIGGRRAAEAVLPLLSSEDEHVRSTAAGVIGQIADDELAVQVGPTLEALLADPDDMVRDEAAEALGLLRYAPARAALERVLRQDDEWVVRCSAAWALGEFGDASALSALENALADEFAPVRSYSAHSIGLLGDDTLLPVLDAWLAQETEPATRGELLVAKLRLGGLSAFDELLTLVDTADDDLAINLFNTLENMLSQKTPAVVIGRANELEPRLARLGGDRLRARLSELVGNGANE